MKKELQKKIFDAVNSIWPEAGLKMADVEINFPPGDFGDFSCNVAMKLAGRLKKSPMGMAEEIKERMWSAPTFSRAGEEGNFLKKIEVVQPGFLNFFLNENEFKKVLAEIFAKADDFGKGDLGKGKNVMVEFGQPNTHKAITVGHLKSAISGLSVARLFEALGYKVIKANYFGDVGMHVAKSTWGIMQKDLPDGFEEFPSDEKMKAIDTAYVEGAKAFEEDGKAQEEIRQINKDVYAKTDNENYKWYQKIRDWSIQHQDDVFGQLGIVYDRQYPESEVYPDAVKIVKENPKGIFTQSEGATIFDGKKVGLTSWVFLTKEGNATYSAKDLALAKKKFSEFDLDLAIVTTSVEQEDYFKSVIYCLEKIDERLKGKYKHIPFGWLLMGGKKTSSRMGKTVKCLDVVSEAKQIAEQKIDVTKDYDEQTRKDIIDKVAMSGLKFLILSHEFRSNINYDPDDFIKLQGFSGPFILYSYVRTQAILRKLGQVPKLQEIDLKDILNSKHEQDLLKHLANFPEVIETSGIQIAPHLVCNHLYETAQKFNAFYENCPIKDAENENEKRSRLALTATTGQVLKNGLWMLGVDVLEKM